MSGGQESDTGKDAAPGGAAAPGEKPITAEESPRPKKGRARPPATRKKSVRPVVKVEREVVTAIVDARPMGGALDAAVAPAPARPATDTELTPAIGQDAARFFVDMERTPLLGLETARLLVDMTKAPSIEVDEVALSEEEQSALASEADPADPDQDTDALLRQVRACFERGDSGGVVREAEALLARHPGLEAAEHYLESGRDTAIRRFRRALGDFASVPRLTRAVEDLSSLDHHAAFVASLIDDERTLEEILDACGMSAFEALRALNELVEARVIQLRPPSDRSRRD